MRVAASNEYLSVRAIAGAEVIIFGLNIPDDRTDDLLGFKIEKKQNDEWYVLHDGRKFENSELALIQSFMWSDYRVDVGTEYTYRYSAAYGDVENPKYTDSISVDIKTENPREGEHAVYFNRGVAGSQAYARNFGDYKKWYKDNPDEQDPSKITYTEYLKPSDVPYKAAYKWLSRGLEEALKEFIDQAKDSSYSIRASLYELSHVPSAQSFIDALERDVDVKILHHAKEQTSYERVSNKEAVTTVTFKDSDDELIYKNSEIQKNRIPDDISQTAMETIGSVGISNVKYLDTFKEILLPRSEVSISHNKFIILLKDGKPIQVWTGSTNITYGGIYGQSNVGQIIRSEDIATQYFNYWKKISEDPKKNDVRNWIAVNNPSLETDLPKNSVSAIFSPREDETMLHWYANKMAEAKDSVFLTLAFSIDDSFNDVVVKNSENNDNDAFLRYILFENRYGQYIRNKYAEIAACEQNQTAWGETLKQRNSDDEKIYNEVLTGLNNHVNYIHTKYMILDALTDDPIVITGSANFSKASTKDNDENMLIIRGNIGVADVYICEFMRLFNHFQNRNESNSKSNVDFDAYVNLDQTSAWRDPYYKEGTKKQKERVLFANREVQ